MGRASDEACCEARAEMRRARANCLTAIANCYGHPVEACSVEVLAAVNAAIRAGFDLGDEFAHERPTIPPPPPTDAEVLRRAEGERGALRRG